jgi:hypothetical protein
VEVTGAPNYSTQGYPFRNKPLILRSAVFLFPPIAHLLERRRPAGASFAMMSQKDFGA